MGDLELSGDAAGPINTMAIGCAVVSFIPRNYSSYDPFNVALRENARSDSPSTYLRSIKKMSGTT